MEQEVGAEDGASQLYNNDNLFLTTFGEEFAVYKMIFLQCFLVPFDFVDLRSPKTPNSPNPNLQLCDALM